MKPRPNVSIELLKSISTQKAHKTCHKQGSKLHYLVLITPPNRDIVSPLATRKRKKIMQDMFLQIMPNLQYDKLGLCIKTILGEHMLYRSKFQGSNYSKEISLNFQKNQSVCTNKLLTYLPPTKLLPIP